MVRAGTFLLARPSGNGGVIPADDHATLRGQLAEEPGVEFAHGLDFRDSYVRRGRVHCGDVCLNDLDLYLWHVDFARKPGTYDLDALATLRWDTAVVPDPERTAVAFDKHWSSLALARAGVPVPDNVLVSRRNLEAVQPVIEEWGHAVLKPRRGCFGWGVLFVDLERFYPNSPDEWLGVTLVGQEVVHGFRNGPYHHVRWNDFAWKVYDAERGGAVEHREVPATHVELARRAQRAFGLPLLVLDFICHEGEPIVVDVNTGPALHPELFAAAGRSLPHELHRVLAAAIRDTGQPAVASGIR